MKRITHVALIRFAKRHSGKTFTTQARRRPFVVDVIDECIVFYPESGRDFWLEIDDYILEFNRTNGFSPGDYPKTLWCNSYFTALIQAFFKGIKPVGKKMKTSATPRSSLIPGSRFDKKVKTLRCSSKLPAPIGERSPKKKKIYHTQIMRDPAVKAWVLRTSSNRCGACFNAAPFKDDDGLPFLEVHHVIPLAHGGPDTIDNAVALCPNCHRAFHHATNRKKLVLKLYRTHARLKQLPATASNSVRIGQVSPLAEL